MQPIVDRKIKKNVRIYHCVYGREFLRADAVFSIVDIS